MESKMKKLLPLAGLLCGFMGTALHAQGDHNDMRYGQDRNMHQQPGPPGKMHDDHTQRVITPSAGPRVTNGADVFITADFIWWTPREDGLAYAFSGFGDGVQSVSKGEVKQPDWKWEPGFKVGLGLALDHDGWDVYAQYTWLHSDTETSSAGETLYPVWNISNAFNSPTAGNLGAATSIVSARNEWKLRFNVIDLEMARNFFVSQYLTLRPHFGFKGSWQTQDYEVEYRSPTGGVPENVVTSHTMTNNQDYWGFGIRTGMNTAWHFTREFSIYGDWAASALWSNFKVDRKDQNVTIYDPAVNPVVVNTQNDFYSVKAVVEMAIGLRYETWFSDDDYHFLIQAGWEEQVWLNHNQLFKLVEEGSHGDMDLQGLTVKVRFDF